MLCEGIQTPGLSQLGSAYQFLYRYFGECSIRWRNLRCAQQYRTSNRTPLIFILSSWLVELAIKAGLWTTLWLLAESLRLATRFGRLVWPFLLKPTPSFAGDFQSFIEATQRLLKFKSLTGSCVHNANLYGSNFIFELKHFFKTSTVALKVFTVKGKLNWFNQRWKEIVIWSWNKALAIFCLQQESRFGTCWSKVGCVEVSS